MNIVNSLESRIDSSAMTSLSEFVNEPIESLKNSFGLSINYMLAGLIAIAKKEGTAASILKVIKDGGHSGDLIEDLSGLFAKKDKLQLLVTIGKNINSHFFNGSSQSYIDVLATKGGVSSNAAGSLMSLSAPLVLGVLGKNVRTNNWSEKEFTEALLEEEKEVITPDFLLGVAPAASIFDRKTDGEEKAKKVKPKPSPIHIHKEKKNKEGNLAWLAWVFLGLLGISALYYVFKDKLFLPKDSSEVVENAISTDGGDKLNEEGSENSDSFNSNDSFVESPNTKSEGTQRSNSLTKPGGNLEPEKANQSVKAKPVSSTPTPSSGNASDNSDTFKGGNRSYSSTSSIDELSEGTIGTSIGEPVVTKDNRPMSSKLGEGSTGYFGINGLSYKYGSAEIIKEGQLSALVDYLRKNPEKTLSISGTGSLPQLASDRAYALRGVLYANDIALSRIKIASEAQPGNDPVLVSIK